MYWPRALSMPLFRAPFTPSFLCRIRTRRGSEPSISAAVSSVEPSSTTISSQSVNVCRCTLAIAAWIVSLRL